MKQVKFLIFMLLFILIACDQESTISFCENIDKEGKGESCGSVFSAGEINLVVNSKKIFNKNEIKIKIYNISSSTVNPESVEVRKVDSNSKSLQTSVSIYNEGKYKLVINGDNGDIYAEGEVEVVEQL